MWMHRGSLPLFFFTLATDCTMEDSSRNKPSQQSYKLHE